MLEPRRGFGAACYAGLLAATDDVVCFMDCDGSFDGADLIDVAAPVVSGDADLVMGARVAARGSWPLHARVANQFLAWELRRRTHANLHDLGPMRAMRRPDLLALGVEDRRFGWPLEMVLRAVARRLAYPRSRCSVRTANREVESDRHPARHGPRGPRHGRRSPMRSGTTLIVIAKSPQPGRVKTRLCPPCTPEEAARLAEAALADTLEVIAAVPADRHVIALDGPIGGWLPRRFDVVPQVGIGLAERLGDAFARCCGPAFLVGMDTPQINVQLISAAINMLMGRETDAVLGPAQDGGWWGIGLRDPNPRAFDGVEMSTDRTHDDQLYRLAELGLRTGALASLRDVDTFTDAIAVSKLAPGTQFARSVASLGHLLPERVSTS